MRGDQADVCVLPPWLSIHACHPSSYFVFTPSPSYLSLNHCKRTLPLSHTAEMFDWRMHFKLGPARKWNDIIHKATHLCSCKNATLSLPLSINFLVSHDAAHVHGRKAQWTSFISHAELNKYLSLNFIYT